MWGRFSVWGRDTRNPCIPDDLATRSKFGADFASGSKIIFETGAETGLGGLGSRLSFPGKRDRPRHGQALRAERWRAPAEALDDEPLVREAPAIVGRLTPSALSHSEADRPGEAS
ncbi:hypothetical protein GCM10009603_65810 [Nocardiopsis exhalans]